MERSTRFLSRQIEGLSTIAALVTAGALVAFGWWAADRIDQRAVEQQANFVRLGLADIEERTALEQDGSAIGDEAVLNSRARNGAWLAQNAVEWVSSFFGHDRVYVLDPANRPIGAAAQGKTLPLVEFDRDKPAVLPLVDKLRAEMAGASAGVEDSTEAITGLGILDKARVFNNEAAIISVRPILPSTDAVKQAPGSEYLHVSIRLLSGELSTLIAEHYALHEFRFEVSASDFSGAAVVPVRDSFGEILGIYTWKANRPALQLLRDTAPATAGVGLVASLIVAFLLRKLGRTSAKLERSEARARHLALHDSLTQVPNRALFEDRLERALVAVQQAGGGMALHFVDLDRFKLVNDSLGHATGDEVVRLAAARLVKQISPADTLARIGGDEFAIIQPDVVSPDTAVNLAARIMTEMARPFEIDGQEVLIGASVGIAMSDGTGMLPVELMRRADIALYEAKENGRGRYQVFGHQLSLAVQDRRALEIDLRAALDGAGGLSLVYQPIVSASSRTVLGAEALVRWDSPTRGRLAPDKFIGLAEERGLIDKLGIWVLREACIFAQASPLPWIAVNVSPLQFRDERFVDKVMLILQETGLNAERLELEVTEGLLLQNSSVVQDTLKRLRAAGVRIALDDFGTGYSSISYLHTHGVDKLKIDQSYVARLGKDPDIEHIVRCIIELARAMRISVTAEGVETPDQQAALSNMKCEQLQGYLISRPLAADGLATFLATIERERKVS